MPIDIFDFWADLPGDARVHPTDKPVFDRAGEGDEKRHGFDLRCLPAPFNGPLRTARLVLLYLSPGWCEFDVEEAQTKQGHERHFVRRQGYAQLNSEADHEGGYRWWTGHTKHFGEPHDLKDKTAILNIGAYHSKTFSDYHLLAALPSCRATLDWAQSVLFPQAERGERVVICLRSARYWGLGKQSKYGKSLFTLAVNRGGHMKKGSHFGAIRDEAVAAARNALEREPLSG